MIRRPRAACAWPKGAVQRGDFSADAAEVSTDSWRWRDNDPTGACSVDGETCAQGVAIIPPVIASHDIENLCQSRQEFRGVIQLQHLHPGVEGILILDSPVSLRNVRQDLRRQERQAFVLILTGTNVSKVVSGGGCDGAAIGVVRGFIDDMLQQGDRCRGSVPRGIAR